VRRQSCDRDGSRFCGRGVGSLLVSTVPMSMEREVGVETSTAGTLKKLIVLRAGRGGVGREGDGGLVGKGEAKNALVFVCGGEGTGAIEETEKSEKVEWEERELVGLSKER